MVLLGFINNALGSVVDFVDDVILTRHAGGGRGGVDLGPGGLATLQQQGLGVLQGQVAEIETGGKLLDDEVELDLGIILQIVLRILNDGGQGLAGVGVATKVPILGHVDEHVVMLVLGDTLELVAGKPHELLAGAVLALLGGNVLAEAGLGDAGEGIQVAADGLEEALDLVVDGDELAAQLHAGVDAVEQEVTVHVHIDGEGTVLVPPVGLAAHGTVVVAQVQGFLQPVGGISRHAGDATLEVTDFFVGQVDHGLHIFFLPLFPGGPGIFRVRYDVISSFLHYYSIQLKRSTFTVLVKIKREAILASLS